MPRVYAPTPFRWTDGVDYPFGYFEMPDDSKARAMKSAGKVADGPGDSAASAAAASTALLASQIGKSRTLKKLLPGRLVVFGNQDANAGGVGSDQAVGTNWTTVLQMELEAPFSAVRIWVPNADTAAAATQTKVAVAVQQQAGAFGDAANIDYSAGDGLINATFDNGVASAAAATSNAIAAAVAANRPTWKATDWIGIKSLARTDGGTRPLLQVRIEQVWLSANWKLTCPYIPSAGWKDGVSAGGRLYRRFGQNVNGVSSPTTFTSTSDPSPSVNKWCPVIVEYQLASGYGVEHMPIGDSTDESAGSSDAWYGYNQRAVYELSTPTAPRDFVNCALHSQPPSVYSAYALDMLPIVQPNLIHYKPYSINDVTDGGDLSTAIIRGCRQQMGKVVAAAAAYSPGFVILAGLPCMDKTTYSAPNRFKAYTSDSRRLALNADLAAGAQPTARWYFADIATPLAGVTNGSGQQLLLTTVVNDGAHPNDVGNDLAKVPLKAQIPPF